MLYFSHACRFSDATIGCNVISSALDRVNTAAERCSNDLAAIPSYWASNCFDSLFFTNEIDNNIETTIDCNQLSVPIRQQIVRQTIEVLFSHKTKIFILI